MPTSRKQPKAKLQEPPKPDVPQTLTLTAAPGSPSATVAAADLEYPFIDLTIDKVADGSVTASVHVEQSAAGIPLGRVEWKIDDGPVVVDKILNKPATWDGTRSFAIPNPGQENHGINARVYNRTGPSQSDRNRGLKYVAPVDKQPPRYTIFAPNRVGSADGKATIKISGTAQDAICGRVVPFDRLLDPLVETATQPVNSDVCVPIESTAPKDGATL